MHLHFKEGSIGKACSAQPSSARKAQPRAGTLLPRDLASWSTELSGRSLSSYFSRFLLVLLPSFPSFSFFDLLVVVVVVLVCVCVCLCKGAHGVCGMRMCAYAQEPKGQHWLLVLSRHLHPSCFLFLRQSLSLVWSSPSRPGWLATGSRGISDSTLVLNFKHKPNAVSFQLFLVCLFYMNSGHQTQALCLQGKYFTTM